MNRIVSRVTLGSAFVSSLVFACLISAQDAEPQCGTSDLGGLIARIANAHTLEERTELAGTFVREGVLKEYSLPGMSVAVAIDGKIVWSEAFGFADLEAKVRATPNTKFRAGSVSKVFTAAGVALLHEQGKLDLDAPVQKYVPEFPTKGNVITTRQLTGHLAGIRHYNEGEVRPEALDRLGEEQGDKRFKDVISALRVFKDDPLVAIPGERWSYSSYAWTLVSAVVERAAGQSFLEFMRGKVFHPLGMVNTLADHTKAKISNRARLYVGYGEELTAVSRTNLSSVWAGGGFLSTAEDMVRFGSALLPDSGFLSPDTKKLMFTHQQTSAGEETPTGIGWFIDRLPDGSPVYHHGGTVTGGHSVLLIRPRDKIVVAMIANHSSGFKALEASLLANILLGSTDIPILVGAAKDKKRNSASKSNLNEAIDVWESGLKDGNLTAAMSVVSEEFSSKRWKNKAALREELRQLFTNSQGLAIEPGRSLKRRGHDIGSFSYLDGALIPELMKDKPVRLTFIKEKAGWKLVDLRPESR